MFSPPSYCYDFFGTDFITTTDSSATSILFTNPYLSVCLCLVLNSLSSTSIEASLVKQTVQYCSTSVLTFSRIRILSFGTFCNLTPTDCQNRFTHVMFTVLTKPSFKPCRCQQRSWLCIAFLPVRRRSFLSNCRTCLHARQTKSHCRGSNGFSFGLNISQKLLTITLI